MDPTIVLVLVLTALFLGAIAWLVIYSRRQQIYSRRQQSVAARDRQPAPPGGEDTRRTRARR
jgi:hypothetical protein